MKCRLAKDSDLDNICQLLAEEFDNDHLHKVMLPDQENRIELLKGYFHIYVDLAQKRGGTFIAENNVGALVYFRPEYLETSEEDDLIFDKQLREICGTYYETLAAYTLFLNQYHPRTPAHYYIPLIAVKSSSRGRGVANSLFSSLHALADKDKSPCYMECTQYSTRTLFAKFGYQDLGLPLHIKGFPELYPVWREPQPLSPVSEIGRSFSPSSDLIPAYLQNG